MMYSRKFNTGSEDVRQGAGMIPPDYGGVAYRSDAIRAFDEEKSAGRRPRRALYKESDPPEKAPQVFAPLHIERHGERSREGDVREGNPDTGYAHPRHRRYKTASPQAYSMNPIGQQEDTDGPDPGKSKARMNPSEKAENAAYYGRETSRFDGEFTNYEDGEEDPFHASLGEAGDDAERGPRKDRETEDRSRSDPEEKRSGLLPGISRLAKHSFTMEDLLLAGIISLLLNGDGDSDLLLILGFLLLTGL